MADGTTLTTEDVTKAFEGLEGLVVPQKDGNLSSLRTSWHYLQVYAGWGLRLPTTEAEFKLVLKTDKVGEYLFYNNLSAGSLGVRDACRVFQSETLPDIIKVGNDLERYAKNASNKDGEMFSIILQLLDGPNKDPETALDLLKDLKKDAQKALDQADKAQKGLSAFQASITIAAAKLGLAKDKIDEDGAVNDTKIKTLAANDPELAGSIANLNKLRKDAKDEYDRDVTIASTTVTYAWVGFPIFPIGLIAAASVAGVYGDKAVKQLAEVDSLDAQLKTAQEDLGRAVAVQGSYHLASAAAANMSKYTEKAILHCDVVKNGWNELLKLMGSLSDAIGRTLKTDDDGNETVRQTIVVKTALTNTEAKWRALVPYLEVLTTAPYIQIAPNVVSISEFKQQVEAEVKKAA